MKTVMFDLETIADQDVVKLLPEPIPNQTLKDPAKIINDIKEKKLKQLETLGLDPATSLICCASFFDYEAGTVRSVVLEDESGKAEAKLLREVWVILHPYERFVSFNGNEFDVPMLTFHSMLRRVPMSVKISRKKWVENHVDVRGILSNYDKMAKGNFDFYCKRILGEGKPKDIDGSMVQHYWDCGMKDDIRKYCEDDVTKLALLFGRVAGWYL